MHYLHTRHILEFDTIL